MLDGDTVTIGGRAWRCISGYGHAPEHIALYCEELNVLLGGDMMLPRISTNVSVHAGEPEANALRLFLDSIERFKALPADTLACPRTASPSPASTDASSSCRSTTATAWPNCWKPARRGR